MHKRFCIAGGCIPSWRTSDADVGSTACTNPWTTEPCFNVTTTTEPTKPAILWGMKKLVRVEFATSFFLNYLRRVAGMYVRVVTKRAQVPNI
jgi:hypothetical protein